MKLLNIYKKTVLSVIVAAAALSTSLTVLPSATTYAASSICVAQVLRTGVNGDCTRVLQQALTNKGYSVGTVDGVFGAKTTMAVKLFQSRNQLSSDGVVGQATWSKLGYTIGGGLTGIATSHLSSYKSHGGVNIIADKSDRKAYVFYSGTLLRVVDVRFGGMSTDQDGVRRNHNTPVGVYKVYSKIKDGYSNKYDASMPYFTVFNGDIGFHYSSDFARNAYGRDGRAGSHGCVNIRNMADAKYIFDISTAGSTVVVVQS